MAQKRTDIKSQMTDSFISNPSIQEAYGLIPGKTFEQEFSIVSIENILFEIISYALWLVEVLFDTHKEEVDKALYNQKSGRLPWYRTMALRFQYGFDLLPDSDEYDNDGATQEQIAESKVVKYAAVSEGSERGLIILKIAGENNGILEPVTADHEQSFQAFMNRIKYAGTKIQTRNYEPDKLALTLVIYRDPLLMAENGTQIKTGEPAVENAILNYLKVLPFDGELVLEHLIDALQRVEGVLIPHLVAASSSAVNPTTGEYEEPQPITVKKVPESGYFKLENFDGIQYVV